jgi:hypothetical protein
MIHDMTYELWCALGLSGMRRIGVCGVYKLRVQVFTNEICFSIFEVPNAHVLGSRIKGVFFSFVKELLGW